MTDKKSLITKCANNFGTDPGKLLETLKKTAFKQSNGAEISNEQMMSLLVVVNQYGLNPFTKEIYAFPDKSGGIVPVVGVDGWNRIINQHPQLDGIEFRQSEDESTIDGGKRCPKWIECLIYRKDRSRPIVVREYLDEVYKPAYARSSGGPWQTHTKRMLRHKALIQCARVAFSYSGIYEEDEGTQIIQNEKIIDHDFLEMNEKKEFNSKSDEVINLLTDNQESITQGES